MEPRATRSMLDAVRSNPEWRKLYFARTISLLGNWLNTLAIVHLLGEGQVTAALPLAVVFVLKQAPVTLLGPPAGVVADRFERRRIMVTCDLLSFVTVLCFLGVEPGGSRALIYALTALQVASMTFFDPAYRAVVPDLLRPGDLVAANALGAASWSAMYAAGTALGGVVLYTLGWRVAFVLDAVTYLVSAALISTVRSPARRPRAARLGGEARRASLGAILGVDEVREGLRYILSHGPVRRIIAVKLIWGLMGALTLFLTILGFSPGHHLSGSGDLGVSFLWFARAVGTGLGPPLARWWTRDDPAGLRGSIAVGFGLALGFYGLIALTGRWWLTGVWVLCAHVGGSMVWVMSTVLLQQEVPTELRGRTFAAELGLVMLSSSASHLVYGALLDRTALEVPGAILISVGVCAVPALWWAWRVGLRA